MKGAVHPSEQNSSPIAELATKLLLKPNVTRVSCGRTTNNTYRIAWRDAYVSRMSDEILSVGYANWVDQQIGVGLTNGLYKFTARFEDAPPEPTQLYIGDCSVCVSNAGEWTLDGGWSWLY